MVEIFDFELAVEFEYSEIDLVGIELDAFALGE